MANTFNPDPLNYGGKRWDVLVKNSSQDGDYSWQSLDPKYPETQQQAFERNFAWQAKDYALLSVWDPMNSLKFNTDNRPGYRLSNGTGDGNNCNFIEFLNIPQTYRTLVIKGEFYGERGSYPNWVNMRFNNYSGSGNTGHYSRWAWQSTSTQNVDNSSQFYIARYYQPDSYNSHFCEIHIPNYTRPNQQFHWYGWRGSEAEIGYLANGYGWVSTDKSDTGRNVRPVHRIRIGADSGYFHPMTWVALYGIK